LVGKIERKSDRLQDVGLYVKIILKLSLERYGMRVVGSHWTQGLVADNPLNAELNSICHLLALLGAHPILYDSRIRVNTEMFGLTVCYPKI
jgi:hypothetical protein